MNTSGMLRGYMSKNMNVEEFMKVVVKAFSREFKEDVQLEIQDDGRFLVTMKDYQVTMSKEQIETLQSPYGIDKFILKEFEGQWFKLDRNRSQYIQYCFGSLL